MSDRGVGEPPLQYNIAVEVGIRSYALQPDAKLTMGVAREGASLHHMDIQGHHTLEKDGDLYHRGAFPKRKNVVQEMTKLRLVRLCPTRQLGGDVHQAASPSLRWGGPLPGSSQGP